MHSMIQKSKLLCPQSCLDCKVFGTERGRNVGGNVGETGSSLESLVAWCGFGIFVGARVDGRKRFMETL